jgi:predicted nuclease of predicted toxin-antitoxin system
MPQLRFLANMNIFPEAVRDLQNQGWDIIRIPQVLQVNASDQEVLIYARLENRVLITQDLDFSSLLALGNFNRPSLITLQMFLADPETLTRRMLDILPIIEKDLKGGCAVTVDEAAIRIRKLPIE